MKFQFLTIFPDIFDSYFGKGMMRIAIEKKIIKTKIHNLRDFAVDNRGTVDDRPYGGGPGQVMMVEPIYKALLKLQKEKERNSKTSKTSETSITTVRKNTKVKIVLLSAKGKKWDQQMAQKFSKLDEIVFICPRYEGHDARIEKMVDEQISIGDFILTGGELGAMVITDSITRLLPGVLGKQESLDEESHSTPGYLEYPHYSRPEIFKFKNRNLRVPKVLLTGHHKNISEWRKSTSQNS